MIKTIKRLLLYITTLMLTGIFRFLILFVRFKALADCIATEKGEYDDNIVLCPSALGKLREIIKAIEIISNHTPWKSQCLVKALTGMTLLRLFKIQSVLYLGLSNDKAKGLEAHAWLKVGKNTIIGGEQMSGFSVINWYVGKGGCKKNG